ncbi:MAG: hypothetical protein ACTHMS_21685, partial [Jatrophihabitans sp.]|uniref:hypothetical protein n=1 Tax=Jatrophihabitans sp. TaxID=1932789 RepID=UPI003F7D1434
MRRSRRSRRAVSLLAIAGLVLGTATVVSAPASVAAPPPGLDQDVSDIWSGLESLQSFSQGLATDGALGTALTDVALIPGGSDGIGFVDLLQKTLTDRLDATDTTFAKLAAALNGNSVNLGSGRTAKVQVVPGSATGRESLAVTLDVTKRVSAAPLTIGTTSPKFDFAAPVQVDLALHGTFTVVYDTAARAVYLDTTSTAVPTFTLAADAHFPCSPASSTPPCTQDTSGVHAGIGILGVSLNSGSSLDLTTSLTATLRDPNADGKVYLGTISGSSFQPFAEPLNGGTTPGELNGGAAAVPGLVTLTGPTGALHATLNLAASTDSSITLPGVSATVQVDWNDVTSGSPTVNVTSGALSAIQSFENLTPGDLAQGLAGLATALEAVQMSRTYKPTSGGRAGTTAAIAAGALTATYTATSGGKPQVNDLFQVGGSGGPVREVSAVDGAGPYTVTFGSPLNTAVADGTTLTQVDAKGDIDLPFMKGTLADVFQANEAITGFLNKHVKQTYNAQPNANTGTVSGASGTSATYTVVDGGAPAAGEYYTIGDETLKVGSVSGTGPYNLSFTTPFAGAHADGSAATQVALGALVPDFSSLQSMLASLQTTQDLPGGSQFTVGDVGYDDTTHKLAIGLSISRAAGSAQDLDAFTPVDSGTISSVGTDAGSGAPTLKDTGKSWQTNAYAGHRVRSGSATNVVKSNDGSTLVLSGAWVGGTPGAGDAYDIGGQDAGTGAISFANKLDSLGGGSGILNANASVPLATVTPSYSVNLTVVLDLEAPQTGDGCKNKLFNGVVNTQACPFTSNNTDGTSTVVTTLPTPADRIMIRTVDGSNNPLHLLTADAPIASKVVVNASVGFLGLGLTGDLHECAAFTSGTTDCDSSQHLLSVDFQPGLGDAQHDISLAELFAKLASGPASLIKVTVTGAAKATITPKITGIPGLSDTDFFGAGGAPTLTLSMTDITDPSTIHLDANGGSVADALGKIKAFNFDTSNPKALFGEILQTLKTLSKLLKNVSSSGSPTIQAALDTKIPVVGLTLGDIFRSSEQGQGDHVKYTSTQVQDSDGHFTDELLLRTVVAGTSTGVITATTPTTLTIKQWQGGTPADGSQYQVENALDSAIDLLTANPADSLQSLISLVNERLGAASIPISISVDLSHGTPTLGLQLDWKRDFHFTTPVSFDFNVGGNDSSIVGTQASGLVQLHANAEAKVKLLLPLSADPTDESGAATPAGLLVDPTQTSLSAGVDAGVGGFVKANFGPLSLSLGDPTQPDGGSHPAEAHAAFGASFNSPDTAPESISTFLGNVGSNSVHLNGGVTGVSCANDTPPTTLGLCAALPVYLSTDGGQHYNPVNATNDPTKDPDTLRLRLPLVTATPSNIGDLADQFKLTDSSGNALPLSASDSTKRFELPPSLASDLAHAVLDFSQLGGGLDGYFKFAEQALNLASFGGKVPLIGKDLQQGAQFLEHVQGEVDGVLGDLASVGNEAQLRDWVDNKLNDALKDVLPAGGKITADFVCSAQLATPTNVAGTAAKTDTPTTGYQYRVAASDPKGDTAASAAITVTSSALSATNTITVTWTKVDGASGYRLYRSSDGGTTWKEFDVATSDTPSFTDTGAAGTDGTPPTGPNPDLSPCPISKTTGVTLTGDIGQGKISADKGCEDDGANLCIGSGNPGLHTPLNIGIPGLSLAAATNDDGTPDPTQELAVRVGWHIHLKIGLDLHRGFFVETQDQKNPEIQVGLAVQLPKSIQAQISFLKVNLCDFATGQSYPPTASPSCPFKPLVPNGVTRTAGSPTPLFAGAFGIDLHTPTASVTAFDDPGFTANDDAANDITLKDLTNLASLKKLVTVGISAKVHIDWDFQAVLDSSLPGVGGEFKLDWQWGTSLNKPAVATDSGNDATPPADGVAKPDIEFDNVYISAGGFLSGVLKPIIKEVQQFTSPLKPVIDTLYAPIPVLSDLSHLAGGGDVTLISIAEAFSTLAGGPDLTMVDRILQVIKLVNAIPTGDDGLGIFIGSFKVSSSKAVGTAATPDNTDSLIDTKTPAPASQNGNKSAADAMDGASNGSIGTAKSKAGFSFPILDNPSSVFNLLMGGDVDLIRFDSGNLSLGFSYSQQFGPVYAPPPVVITISGSASVSARIIAGFDTYGLRKAYEAIKSGQGAGSVIGSILDSLFLYTVDPTKDDGKPVPVLTLTGELAAGASVTVLIVSVGIEGGIKLTINFYWNDPDNDGKFRASEFAKTAINNPLCLFNVDGKLSVFLRLGVTIGFGPFSTTFHITLVDITLLDFSVHPDCTPPPPELGEVQGTTLYLFFGHLGGSGQRGEPWGNSGEDETVKVHELHDFTDPQHPTFAGFSVDGLGRHEEFRDSGLQTVVLDAGGYSGKETVIIGGDSNQSQPAADGPPTPLPFDRTAVVVGGDAADNIKIDGGTVFVDGKGGDDTVNLTGNGVAKVAGGAGNDTLTVGNGDDVVAGDSALDTSRPVTLTDHRQSEPKGAFQNISTVADSLGAPGAGESSSDGNDSIFAGYGANTLLGNGGNDQLSVATDKVLTGNETRQPGTNASKGDTIVGGTGDNNIHGGAGDDTIYAGQRWTSLSDKPNYAGESGDGNNQVDTGAGSDTVYGGSGADFVIGHSVSGGHDTVYGGGGSDVIAGGDGSDHLYGGPGPDYLSGGPAKIDTIDPADPTLGAWRITPTPDGKPVDHKLLVGGDGADHIVAGNGGDTIYGDREENQCVTPPAVQPRWTPPGETSTGTPGNDWVQGGAGDDNIAGGAGADILTAGTGTDVLCGEAGADKVYGGPGTDTLFGGSGDDLLVAGTGNSGLYGNDGADTVLAGSGNDWLEGNGGADKLDGGTGQSVLIGGSSTAAQADTGDTIFGGSGDNVLIGDNGTVDANSAWPGSGKPFAEPVVVHSYDLDSETPASFGGNDVITGGSGDVQVYAGVGDDYVVGGTGTDHLEGGPGSDTMYTGPAGDDVLGGTSPQAVAGGSVDGIPDGSANGTDIVPSTLTTLPITGNTISGFLP